MIYHYRIRPRGLEDDVLSAFVPQLPRCIIYFRVSQTGPSAPLGATERFSGANEQRPSLGSFAVILHDPSVTMYYVFARVFWRGPRIMKVWEPLVYLLFFCCIANHLIRCSLCDMKEEAGAKVKRENNLQRDRSFNDLQNMPFLVSSIAQVSKEQMTVLGRFGVHICITFWVELNVNKLYISQATFIVAVAAYIQHCI